MDVAYLISIEFKEGGKNTQYNTIPSKEQMEQNPELKSVKVFKCERRGASKRSSIRIETMYSELKVRLLKPWRISERRRSQVLKRKRSSSTVLRK